MADINPTRQPDRNLMRKRKLVALFAGAGLACTALGVVGGYVGASLNPAHDGARGVQGVPGNAGADGTNGTNANVGTIGLCVNGTSYGNDWAITDITRANLDKDKSIVCQAGSFVSVKPSGVLTP
jgi:hypothetical protein